MENQEPKNALHKEDLQAAEPTASANQIDESEITLPPAADNPKKPNGVKKNKSKKRKTVKDKLRATSPCAKARLNSATFPSAITKTASARC